MPGAICLVALLAIAGVTGSARRPQHDIRIAFGFHVGLYHSFRNDTNDETGFGKDIRIIRHTIETLDKFNGQGVPVKGVWEFDNLFSLQELLPRYAPDIVEDIRRRLRENGDEVILMSYNNGLVSAMTEREATDAVRWSVSNPWKSGVKDIFGEYTPIVRPQEMMTTPGDFSIYKKAGVEAVCLYYSEIPFDAFRVFSRPLTLAEAHNPLLYENSATGEEMTIVPTYSIGDLMENVSLEHWVEKLRARQKRGEIDDDLLLFINFDADSDFWSGVDLHWSLDWLPNTGGHRGPHQGSQRPGLRALHHAERLPEGPSAREQCLFRAGHGRRQFQRLQFMVREIRLPLVLDADRTKPTSTRAVHKDDA